jgi:hypothetical protein
MWICETSAPGPRLAKNPVSAGDSVPVAAPSANDCASSGSRRLCDAASPSANSAEDQPLLTVSCF